MFRLGDTSSLLPVPSIFAGAAVPAAAVPPDPEPAANAHESAPPALPVYAPVPDLAEEPPVSFGAAPPARSSHKRGRDEDDEEPHKKKKQKKGKHD